MAPVYPVPWAKTDAERLRFNTGMMKASKMPLPDEGDEDLGPYVGGRPVFAMAVYPSLNKTKGAFPSDTKQTQLRLSPWTKQENAEIRERNIRDHEFAKLIDRYFAGEEITDISDSAPEQPILVLNRDKQRRTYQIEFKACTKPPLPDEDDDDL